MAEPGTFGTMRRRRKLGEIVAERIVDDIVRRGWNEGEVLGTEADFMERFRISRATFREAARQLEWQGAAGMRRGASGGLTVRAPPRGAIISALKTYFELTKISRKDLDAVENVLRAAPRLRAGSSANVAIELFLEALDERCVADLVRDRSAEGQGPKLSESIALKLVRDIDEGDLATGENLGNEVDLQQRYGVSRAVMRESLRLLELHRVIRVKTGAAGGIFIDGFDPDYTIGLASTYLTFAKIPLSHLWAAQSSLELAAVDRFAAHVDAPTLLELKAALARLEGATASHYLASARRFHQIVADQSGNRVIALFVGILLTFSLPVLPVPDARFLPELKRQHRRLVDAVEAGDTAGAVQQMRAMFEQSRRWIAGIEAQIERKWTRDASA